MCSSTSARPANQSNTCCIDTMCHKRPGASSGNSSNREIVLYKLVKHLISARGNKKSASRSNRRLINPWPMSSTRERGKKIPSFLGGLPAVDVDSAMAAAPDYVAGHRPKIRRRCPLWTLPGRKARS